MKNKHGKGARPGNDVLDGQAENRPGEGRSWLTGALGLDEDSRLGQASATASEVFLQSRLFPHLLGAMKA